MGTYSEWDEEKKLEFLTKELKGKRPLVPLSIEVSEMVRVFGILSTYLPNCLVGQESFFLYFSFIVEG